MDKNAKSSLLALFVALALITAACGSQAETETAAAEAADTTEAEAAAEESSDDPIGEADAGATAGESNVVVDVVAASDDAINGGKPTSILPQGTPLTLETTDLIQGDGDTAAAGDLLVMHYVGVLEDGSEFDASWDRGDTFGFTLGQGRVIQGWDEGIVGMQEGGRRVLSIPAEQAYGADGRPGIPANSPLYFVVDLVEVLSVPDVENAPAPVTALEVTVLEEGDGEIVEVGDVVDVHFVALFQETGQQIGTSFAQGEPVTFEVGAEPTQMLAGFDEAIPGNTVGSWLRIVVPPELSLPEPVEPDPNFPSDSTIVAELLIVGVR